MKIVHITTSDCGGAGNATNRLHQGLLKLGADSSLLCMHKGSTTQAVFQSHQVSTAVAENNHLRLSQYSRDYLWFSFARSDYTFLESHPLVLAADIVHLHWIGDFLDWPSFFAKVRKPIVWTFHDRNPVLGGMHLEMDAQRLAGSPIAELENEVAKVKDQAIALAENLHIITPSRLLGERVRKSSRFGRFPSQQISNAIDLSKFKPYPMQEVRSRYGIPFDLPVLMFLSNDFHQPHKGLDLLLTALGRIDQPFHLLTVGPAKHSLGISQHTHIDRTTDENILAQLYSAADAFIIPSREDNLPNVLLESLSCGTPVIGTPIGGMVDYIQNGITGYLAQDVTADALLVAIESFLANRRLLDRSRIRQIAEQEFNFISQAQKHMDLYNKILSDSTSSPVTASLNTAMFTVATSIAPKGLELQRKAIASWLRLGFAVISFNNTAEVELLAPQFPEVRFVTVARDGRARAGKPLVYVQDMLAWFRENREIRYGGFINSDIVVAPEQPDAFLALLQREIGGSLIFSRRIEVENIDRLEGKWNRTGIDLWLWDREILHCYTEPADYMVGFPHWDYYMELLPICHGIPVKQLAIANAYHQTHDAYYDWVRDAVPYALQTFKLIYPHLSKIPDQDHLLLPTINYCFKHQPAQISSQDDLEFLAMFLNTLDKFFLETIDRCSLKLNYHDLPHVPQDQRLSLCLNPEAYGHPAKSPMATRPSMPSHKTGNTNFALTLGTSLSPKDYDKQKVAIASWKALGIDVISFNGAAEVAALSPLYPEVRFITLARDGLALAGRPLVYVDDIIAYFRESGLQLAGFINADIILKPSQPEVFKQLILEQSKRSMLFARRVDIASPAAMDSFWQDLQGTWIRSGIDLWIFDTAMLREYRHQTDYLVGYPHWDFFMCLWPLAQGFSLKELSVPCIFHPVHTQQYDFSNQMRYAMKTYMHIAPLLDRFPVLDRALLNFVQYFAQNQPVRSDDGPGSQFYNSFRYALDIFFLETIFSNCRRVSYAHVDGAQDDIVPGFNHPLHSFGTLEVVLHRMENP